MVSIKSDYKILQEIVMGAILLKCSPRTCSPGGNFFSPCSLFEFNEHVRKTSDTEFSSEILLTSLLPQLESPLVYILENCDKREGHIGRFKRKALLKTMCALWNSNPGIETQNLLLNAVGIMDKLQFCCSELI